MDYYSEMIEKVKEYLNNGKYEEAEDIIAEELKQPYIPEDILNQLNTLKANLPIKDNNYSLSEDKIKEYLKGNSEQQLRAVYYLKGLNLRSYLDECNEYLISKGDEQAKAILIYALIEQAIDIDIKCIRFGQTFNFNPKNCLLPQDSEGFKIAVKIITNYYQKEPSYGALALELLTSQAIFDLPLSLNEKEGTILANKIIQNMNI